MILGLGRYFIIFIVLIHFCSGLGNDVGGYPYKEYLQLRPLPRNLLLTSFNFELSSIETPIEKFRALHTSQDVDHYSHYTVFPRSLGPILEFTRTRELHLKFSNGWWDAEEWGSLPRNGSRAGGNGVELYAWIESSTKDEAEQQWKSLVNSLSGLFCASLNFIDSSHTTYPRRVFQSEGNYGKYATSNLYLMRGVLPRETVCTENLTPFLKLLPCRGNAGIASILDGHKIYDAQWHSMSIDVETVCNNTTCRLDMNQNIDAVINIPRTLRRLEVPVPKPVTGDELRCDMTKPYSIYQCFPLPEPISVNWNLTSLFGKNIKGSCPISSKPGQVCATKTDNWGEIVQIFSKGEYLHTFSILDECFDISSGEEYNFRFQTENSNIIPSLETPPVLVTRSFTGYGQDKGGLRTVFKNTSPDKELELVYYETLPWYMRVYLHTLNIQLEVNGVRMEDTKDVIHSTYYKPAVDRQRPSQLELRITIPPGGTVTTNYDFDKVLILYSEYPPDANRGFDIDPAVVTTIGDDPYSTRTTSLLLTLPTPDFSMPYNVIILTSTVMALVFGTVFNLLIKRLVTYDEAEFYNKEKSLSFKNRFQVFRARITNKFGKVKAT